MKGAEGDLLGWLLIVNAWHRALGRDTQLPLYRVLRLRVFLGHRDATGIPTTMSLCPAKSHTPTGKDPFSMGLNNVRDRPLKVTCVVTCGPPTPTPHNPITTARPVPQATQSQHLVPGRGQDSLEGVQA